jgi:hypothetical protein
MGDAHTPAFQGAVSLGPCQRVGLSKSCIGLGTEEEAGVELVRCDRVGGVGLHDIRVFCSYGDSNWYHILRGVSALGDHFET